MPQMAPMNWIFLYLMFTLIFILFNFLNYYIFTIKLSTSPIKSFLIKKMIWKW
uniref:ATP synthase complex subunit 8 n=1 Tax=Pogonostoma subtiligrossum TaxID=1343354 RepID=A0A343EZ02_9CARA|nr:ATP synthase F0 subunit 8 [Pogonostoma subtiligrossum]